MTEIEELRKEVARLKGELLSAREEARKVRYCWEQDAKRLAWWNKLFGSKSNAEIIRLASM